MSEAYEELKLSKLKHNVFLTTSLRQRFYY